MTIVRPLRYISVNPWENLRRLQEEFSDFMADTLHEVSAGYPPVNVWYNQERAVVEAELPGVAKEDLEIDVLGNTVTLKGERRPKANQGAASTLREERQYGKFGRTIQLPFDLAGDGVQASLKAGVLTLTLPRKEEDKPKRVQISAA